MAALAVGVIVWGLTIWCVIAYRRRAGDPEVPPQLRYHLPLEVMYTAVPLFMVAVLFYYTATSQAAILDLEPEPDHTVEVIGEAVVVGLQLRRRGRLRDRGAGRAGR